MKQLPIETVPKDGTPVLVLLEKPMMKSRVHSAYFYETGVSLIATVFTWDAPKVLGWMPQPSTDVGE